MSLSSLSFAGNADSYLTIANDPGLKFGTGDFTIEWWQYQTDTNSFPRIFQMGNYSTASIGVSIEGGTFYYWNGSPRAFGSLVIYKNTWVHFAICRSANSTIVYKNGIQFGSSLSDSTNYSGSQPLTIGNENNPSSGAGFGGYIVGFNWVKGVALYNANFTPPTTLPSVTGNTVLVLSGANFQGSLGSTVVNTNVTTSTQLPTSYSAGGGGRGNNSIPCFLDGTKILCCTADEKEMYMPIQYLKPGMFVKTYLHGYVKIDMIGNRMIQNPSHSQRILDRLYCCSKNKYPTLNSDLYITGCHAILEEDITDKQREQMNELLGDIYITDDLYRVIAAVDDRAEPYTTEGDYKIWHIALENDSYYGNYGIYANGLLTETCSKRYLRELSCMTIEGSI